MTARAPVARLAPAALVGTVGAPVVVGPTGVLEPVGAVWLPPAGGGGGGAPVPEGGVTTVMGGVTTLMGGITTVELAAEVAAVATVEGVMGGGITIPVTEVATAVVQGTVRVTVPLTTVVV